MNKVFVTISTATDGTPQNEFNTIRQGASTNALTKIRATEERGLTIDNITGNATIKSGSFMLTIPNYTTSTPLRTSTYQLFDAITVALTESGAKSPTVVLPLSKYMERRGLKDRKEAKRKAIEDMRTLRSASISWEEKRRKKTESFSFINIADSGEVKRNGDIVFTYGQTFYQTLLGYPVMPYPAQLQTLNNNNNPNSYYLLRKITEHKNMNVGKPNEDIIAVKTLLAVAVFLPTYEEVANTNRCFTDRIIEPFERDMDALHNTLKWEYCNHNNTPLTDYEAGTMDYSSFEELLIHITWNSYPDQTKRLEKKAERIAEAEEAKKKARKKALKKKAEEAVAKEAGLPVKAD